MRTDEAEILVARTSAVFTDKGHVYRLIKGQTTARRGARILRGREHLLEPLVIDLDDERVEPMAETPVKRGPGRPRKVKNALEKVS